VELWDLVSSWNQPVRIDYVLDNAGPELFADLCLASWLVEAGVASEVHFHTKEFGWFVSDVTLRDFDWLVQQTMDQANEDMRALGARWRGFVRDKRWIIKSDPFWTCADPFKEMPAVAPTLYGDLSKASLVILKGDLNYRKLTGDLKWDPTTPFSQVTGAFKPTAFVALRASKADVIAGLRPGQAEELTEKEKGLSWMTSGKYGLIQALIPQPK